MRRATLEILNGQSKGRRVTLESELVIGKRPDADVQLEDAGISSSHARLAFKNGKLWVVDLNSDAGTFLNGDKLGRRWTQLPIGAKLSFGTVKARVHPPDPAEEDVAKAVGEESRSRTGAYPAPDFNAESGPQGAYLGKEPRGRILLVETQPADIFFASSCLRSEGYLVAAAQDGVEGVVAYGKRPGYDLIICDVGIPDLGGTGFVSYAQEKGVRAPILLTAPGELQQVALKGVKLGAVGYLKKPYSRERLLQKVARCLEQFNAQPLDSADQHQAFSHGPSAQVLEDFKIERSLGKGGMGEVFLATQISLNRPVALKFLNRLGDDEGLNARFLAEARAAAALVHPNVVQIFSVGMDPKTRRPFFAMEYVEGQGLNEKLLAGPPTFCEIIHITRSVARALEKSHHANVVHRDIKPGNIMVSARNEVKVLDFGLAKCYALDPKLTSSGAIVGTPYYLPPEQAEGGGLDSRSDLYSLGIALYEMLAGGLPFSAGSPSGLIFLHSFSEPRSICAVRSNVPKGFEAILVSLMAKRPEGRFQSPVDLIRALDKLEAQLEKRGRLDERPEGPIVDPISFTEAQSQQRPRGKLLKLKGARGHPRSGAPQGLWLAGMILLVGLVLLVWWAPWRTRALGMDLDSFSWKNSQSLFPADVELAGSPGSVWRLEDGQLTATGKGVLSADLPAQGFKIEGWLIEEGGGEIGVFASIRGTPAFGLKLVRYADSWLLMLTGFEVGPGELPQPREQERVSLDFPAEGMPFLLASDGHRVLLEVASRRLEQPIPEPVVRLELSAESATGGMGLRGLTMKARGP